MYIYLASPYSHPSPFVKEERFLKALQATIFLLSQEKWVYSPIVHCHPLVKVGGLPSDFSFWERYNKEMISSAGIFMILRVEGWKESIGVAAEKAFAEFHQIPVEYL